jgi:hypothetical protein
MRKGGGKMEAHVTAMSPTTKSVKKEHCLMKIAYVIGSYRAPTISSAGANIKRVQAVAEQLWAAGFASICPLFDSASMDGVAHDGPFFKGDLRILYCADFVVACEGWETSTKSINEVTFCELVSDMPIYYSAEEAIAKETPSQRPF